MPEYTRPSMRRRPCESRPATGAAKFLPAESVLLAETRRRLVRLAADLSDALQRSTLDLRSRGAQPVPHSISEGRVGLWFVDPRLSSFGPSLVRKGKVCSKKVAGKQVRDARSPTPLLRFGSSRAVHTRRQDPARPGGATASGCALSSGRRVLAPCCPDSTLRHRARACAGGCAAARCARERTPGRGRKRHASFALPRACGKRPAQTLSRAAPCR